MHWPRDKDSRCEDAAAYIIATQPKTKKLVVSDYQGAFLLLSIGLSLALFTFLYELCTHASFTSKIVSIVHVFSETGMKIWKN